jgi:ABC-type methionine transport system ATPase subunit
MSQIRRLVHCTLPPELARRPVLHGLAHASGAVVNVHRANVDAEAGVAWFLLELEGSEAEVDRAESWLREQGVTVERIEDRPPGHGSPGHRSPGHRGSAAPGSAGPS